MNPFNENTPPTEMEKELGSYMDPRQNNQTGFRNGQTVVVNMDGESRQGVIVKQTDSRHFLVKLEWSFNRTNPGKQWLKVCRDYAHQAVVVIV